MCCAGNLPLVLIPALLGRPGVLELLNSSSGSSSGAALLDVGAAADLGLTYVMLGFFIASFIQFPLGYLLLQRSPQQQPQGGEVLQPAVAAATAADGAAAPAASVGVLRQAQIGAQLQQQGAPVSAVAQPLPSQQQQQTQAQLLLRGIFTPPVIACLLAVPVASLPALRSSLFDSGGGLGLCYVVNRTTGPTGTLLLRC